MTPTIRSGSPSENASWPILARFFRLSFIEIPLLTSCATPPAGYRPLPQLHLQPLPPRAAEATNAPPPKFSACLVWQVPTGVVVKAWVVQTSSNLVDFVDMPGNWDCTTPGVQMTNPAGFYRLKGTP